MRYKNCGKQSWFIFMLIFRFVVFLLRNWVSIGFRTPSRAHLASTFLTLATAYFPYSIFSVTNFLSNYKYYPASMTCTCVKFEVVSVSCCNFTVMQPRKHATVFFWIYKLVVFCHPLAHGCITMQEFSPISSRFKSQNKCGLSRLCFVVFVWVSGVMKKSGFFKSHNSPPWCYVWSWLKNISTCYYLVMSSRLYITEHMSTKDTIRLKQWWHDFEASVMSWRSLEIEQKRDHHHHHHYHSFVHLKQEKVSFWGTFLWYLSKSDIIVGR